MRIILPNSFGDLATTNPHPTYTSRARPLSRVLHCLHCRGSEGDLCGAPTQATSNLMCALTVYWRPAYLGKATLLSPKRSADGRELNTGASFRPLS
jgi:hypothetical protein